MSLLTWERVPHGREVVWPAEGPAPRTMTPLCESLAGCPGNRKFSLELRRLADFFQTSFCQARSLQGGLAKRHDALRRQSVREYESK